jgi:hypothetical protein
LTRAWYEGLELADGTHKIWAFQAGDSGNSFLAPAFRPTHENVSSFRRKKT